MYINHLSWDLKQSQIVREENHLYTNMVLVSTLTPKTEQLVDPEGIYHFRYPESLMSKNTVQNLEVIIVSLSEFIGIPTGRLYVVSGTFYLHLIRTKSSRSLLKILHDLYRSCRTIYGT